MKNFIVTGGLGFIGSNLIDLLISKNYYVINVDKITYSSNFYNTQEYKNSKKYKFIKCDIGEKKFKKILFKYKPIGIFNLAAETHVDRSIDNPKNFIKSNFVDVFNLLECFREYSKKIKSKLIHISTDEVYGDILSGRTSETYPYKPSSPYAATKAGAELIAQSYNHSFKMPIIITRGNNVYGPNQYPEKLIPKFIKQLKEGKQVTIQGYGSSLRAFLHVDDVSSAFETLLNKGVIGEIYNIGCDDRMEYSVMDVAKILINKIHETDDYDKWITYIEDRPFNDKRYYISNVKLKKLGWKITINFMDGINSLI